MAKILIIGLTAGGGLGTYETQLGNVAILIPMLELLRQRIPEAEIATTIQLTDEFCSANGVTRIPRREFEWRYLSYIYPRLQTVPLLIDLLRAGLWRLAKKLLSINLRFLIGTNRLRQFAEATTILDFNGDIFPSDANATRVLNHTLEIVTIRQLGTPVVEFASSPGPFNTRFRRTMSRIAYRNMSVIVNREPISSELLGRIGIKKTPIVNGACPSFLLKPAPADRARQILVQENVHVGPRPLIGITLAGYNLASQRTWGKPKSFDDLRLFVPMVKYLLDDLHATVFLLPHVYRINPYTHTREFINGPDHDILLHLYRLSGAEEYPGRFKVIEGKYTSAEAKAVIGQCDMYISGRLHAGVAALSQAIPTVLVAYGHKHRGFARLLRQENCVYGGTDPAQLRTLVAQTWEKRQEISSTLRRRLIRVHELIDLDFQIVSEIIQLDHSHRVTIPPDKAAAWVSRGEQP